MDAHGGGDRFDPSLIDEMLALSPAERIARHDQALETVLILQRAGQQLRDAKRRPAPPSPPRPG